MVEFIGMDVGGERSQVCAVNEAGQVVWEREIRTVRREVERAFRGHPKSRVCLEVGGSSAWISRLLKEMGHEVVACNPRRLRLIAESTLKCDRLDAEVLARLARLSGLDGKLVPGVYQRSEATQFVRSFLKVRRALVRNRTSAANAARGLSRSLGHVLPSVKPERLTQRVQKATLPEAVTSMVGPLLVTVEQLSEQIAVLDEQVAMLGAKNPVVKRLQTIDGIGPLTSLAFVSCIEDPTRFGRSRDVGAYLGLRPVLRQSGGQRHQGAITKEGDPELRALLVQAAHALMHAKRASDLKTWARGLAKRVGKKKAIIALARKLAVLMHRLWVRNESFEPQRANQAKETAA
jgi:transposase